MHQQAIETYLNSSPQANRMVAIIYELLAGERETDIAKRFNVERSTITQVKKRYL